MIAVAVSHCVSVCSCSRVAGRQVVNLGRSQPTTSPVRPWAHSVFTQLPDRSCKEAGIGISSCACDMWDEDTFIASTRKWE